MYQLNESKDGFKAANENTESLKVSSQNMKWHFFLLHLLMKEGKLAYEASFILDSKRLFTWENYVR